MGAIEFSSADLKRLRKALAAIEDLDGLLLPKKILKKLVHVSEWLRDLDLAEEPRFSGIPLLGWWRKRQRRRLIEEFYDSRYLELMLQQMEISIQQSKVTTARERLELKFWRREFKKGKNKPSYVR